MGLFSFFIRNKVSDGVIEKICHFTGMAAKITAYVSADGSEAVFKVQPNSVMMPNIAVIFFSNKGEKILTISKEDAQKSLEQQSALLKGLTEGRTFFCPDYEGI